MITCFYTQYLCGSIQQMNPTFERYPGVIDEDVHSSILVFEESSSGDDAVQVVDVQLVKHGLQSL